VVKPFDKEVIAMQFAGHKPPLRCAFILNQKREIVFLMQVKRGRWAQAFLLYCAIYPSDMTRLNAIRWVEQNFQSMENYEYYPDFILGVAMMRRLAMSGKLPTIKKDSVYTELSAWGGRVKEWVKS
jgi:hypothetical protein